MFETFRLFELLQRLVGSCIFGMALVAPGKPAVLLDPRALKLAQRVTRCIEDDAETKNPRQLDPNFVLVSPLNRLQTAPNVQRIHWGILFSIMKHSYDRTRPQTGVCVEIKSGKGLKLLLEYNHRFYIPEPV